MVVLKAKRTRHLKFRTQERKPAQKGPAMTAEPTRTYLGTVTIVDGEALAFNIPADAEPDAIKAAIEKAEAEKVAAAAAASERLRALFLKGEQTDG
jgi:hypothetical protein